MVIAQQMHLISVNIPFLEILVASGVERIRHRDPDGLSWIAREAWQVPTNAERGRLLSRSLDDWPEQIVVVQLAPALLTLAHETLVNRVATASGAANQGLADAITTFRSTFAERLSSSGIHLDNSGPADIIVNPPGVRSTAYDYALDRVIGLHIDNHQEVPLAERSNCFILACLNIGWDIRYINLVPASVAELLKAIGEPPTSGLAPRTVKDRFFESSPEISILRIAIPPGAAYLLNTQNCIHDGATPAGDVPDVAFLMMGKPG